MAFLLWHPKQSKTAYNSLLSDGDALVVQTNEALMKLTVLSGSRQINIMRKKALNSTLYIMAPSLFFFHCFI